MRYLSVYLGEISLEKASIRRLELAVRDSGIKVYAREKDHRTLDMTFSLWHHLLIVLLVQKKAFS